MSLSRRRQPTAVARYPQQGKDGARERPPVAPAAEDRGGRAAWPRGFTQLARYVGHGWDADASGSNEAVERDGVARHHVAQGADHPSVASADQARSRHTDARIFPQPPPWLHIQHLARFQPLLEHVAIAV